MPRLLDFTRYDPDAPGAQPSPAQADELKQIANLFLVSAITLALFLMRAFAVVFAVTFIPDAVYLVWGLAMLLGWAMTCVYAIFVTLRARRWWWLVLCAIPFTSVPMAAAYAWVRRQELEREVLGDSGAGARQRRGGRRRG